MKMHSEEERNENRDQTRMETYEKDYRSTANAKTVFVHVSSFALADGCMLSDDEEEAEDKSPLTMRTVEEHHCD